MVSGEGFESEGWHPSDSLHRLRFQLGRVGFLKANSQGALLSRDLDPLSRPSTTRITQSGGFESPDLRNASNVVLTICADSCHSPVNYSVLFKNLRNRLT